MDAIFNLQKDNNDSKSNSIMKQAENFWSMLDNMADSSPDAYKYFFNKKASL